MRTLYDIIEAAKDGGIAAVTHQECYLATLVLTGLVNLATADVRKAAEAAEPLRRVWVDEAYYRYRQALATPPDRYLGANTPGNPEYDKFRDLGKRLVDRAIKQQEGPHVP